MPSQRTNLSKSLLYAHEGFVWLMLYFIWNLAGITCWCKHLKWAWFRKAATDSSRKASLGDTVPIDKRTSHGYHYLELLVLHLKLRDFRRLELYLTPEHFQFLWETETKLFSSFDKIFTWNIPEVTCSQTNCFILASVTGKLPLNLATTALSSNDKARQQHAPSSTLLLQTVFCGMPNQGTCLSLSKTTSYHLNSHRCPLCTAPLGAQTPDDLFIQHH